METGSAAVTMTNTDMDVQIARVLSAAVRDKAAMNRGKSVENGAWTARKMAAS